MTPTPEHLLAFYEAGEPYGIALDWLEERHPAPVPALLAAYAGDPPDHLLRDFAAEEWLRELLWRWLQRVEPGVPAPPDPRERKGVVMTLCPRWGAVEMCGSTATSPADSGARARRLTGPPRRALKRAVLALFPEVTLRFEARVSWADIAAHAGRLFSEFVPHVRWDLAARAAIHCRTDRAGRREVYTQDVPAPELVGPESARLADAVSVSEADVLLVAGARVEAGQMLGPDPDGPAGPTRYVPCDPGRAVAVALEAPDADGWVRVRPLRWTP